MAQDTPSRKLEQYIVRFPDGMRDRLKFEAAKNGRSLNAEIIQRLRWSLETPLDDLKQELPDELWNALEADASAKGITAYENAEKILLLATKHTPEDTEKHQRIEFRSFENERLLSEYKWLAKQREDLLRAVCLQLMMFRDEVPNEALTLAEKLLSRDIDPPLEADEFPNVPAALHLQATKSADDAQTRIEKSREARRKYAIYALWNEFENYIKQAAYKETGRFRHDVFGAVADLVNAGFLDPSIQGRLVAAKDIRDRIAHEPSASIEEASEFSPILDELKADIDGALTKKSA